ncbi:MAG: antibiotic biosynthesis monooxygenase [Gammaproteobacteria bacterium]|nr:antibiotic biosynthesis monooxygenase [Gammaproteobacteria bacterium]MDH5803061.1 antibiotic biosynthesis monooxygenase [Gammaproteobacteria bacterium]
MYVVTNRVPVAKDWQDQFEQRFLQRAGQVDKQPGFVRMEVLKPADEDSPFMVMTLWESEQAFLNWVESEDFKLAHKNPLPTEAYVGQGRMERHTVVVSASK